MHKVRTHKWQPLRITSLCIPLAMAAILWAQDSNTNPRPAVLRDQKIELTTKIRQPFTVTAVGDMIEMQPFSRNTDPAVQSLVSVMRGGDMTVANMEAMIADFDNYSGPVGANLSTKEVADDMANMGIKMVTKANNHTFDGGDPGLAETFRNLERVGIVHAGAGRTLAEARKARFYETLKGLVGFVGIYANGGANGGTGGVTTLVTGEQLKQLRAIRDSIVARRVEVDNPIEVPPPDAEGVTSVFGRNFRLANPGEPLGGVDKKESGGEGRIAITAVNNSLRVVQYNGVTAAQMAQLRAIRDTDPKADHSGDSPNILAAFGLLFKVAPKPGEFSYDMNPEDEKAILRAIRTGKQSSDFLVAAVHWHQNRFAFQHYSFDHIPADFELRFAHEAIDAGADEFVAHGVHTIKGVEIYKGKPIFYGVSNYVFQSLMMPAGGGREGLPTAAVETAGPEGLGEQNELRWAWLQRPDNLEALLTTSHFENGELSEIRIYPVDLGLTFRPGSQFGIPRTPTPEVAKRILDHLVTYSEPFGTKVSIENGVGVIRIAPIERSASR